MSDNKSDPASTETSVSELDDQDLDAAAGGAARKGQPIPKADPEEGGEFR